MLKWLFSNDNKVIQTFSGEFVSIFIVSYNEIKNILRIKEPYYNVGAVSMLTYENYKKSS